MESTTGENEKRLLATTLKERLIEGKNTIIYKELLEEDIPNFLKTYLQNRVQKYFHTDEPFQIKNSKRYDFSYTRIRELKQQLYNAFKEATLFSREEISEIINRTVDLQFDMLVNPQEALTKIFFRKKSERTQTDILQVLKGLVDDRLFIKKLKEKIKEFDQFHILEDDFTNLMVETQDEIYKRDLLSSFISDVKAFLDFVSHIKGIDEKSINKEILFLLLNERNLDKYHEAFNNSTNTNDWIELEDVASILKEYINNNGSIKDQNKNSDDSLEDFLVSVIDSEPLDAEQVKQDISTTESEIDIVLDKSETDCRKHHPIIVNTKDPEDFIINHDMIEYQPEGPLAALSSLIDEKSKRLIQKKIFKKDDVAYVNFICRLEEIYNWKEAKQIIDDELMMRSIPPFSKEALTLGDLVFNRYFPKKN